MTVFYIVNLTSPLAPIREVDCLVVQRKFTWAEDHRKKRHLVGASAFYTSASAKRCKQGMLTKIVKNGYLARMVPHLRKAANDQLSGDFAVVPLRRA